VRHRREAEDILCKAGAAILHLPDFYGPQVHVSTLQNALNEAASGKTVNWLGKADVQREYIYVPDAMRIAAAIGARAEAFGMHWCLPGGGPLSGRQAADIAGRHLGRPVKLRSAGITMLRIPACAANAPGSSLGSNVGSKRFGPTCFPAHNRQSDRRGYSALRPNHGRLSAVSPWVRPFPPRPPLEVAFLCSIASSVL
jgi:hypothetical protein